MFCEKVPTPAHVSISLGGFPGATVPPTGLSAIAELILSQAVNLQENYSCVAVDVVDNIDEYLIIIPRAV